VWSQECQESFDDLRKALREPPVLAYPLYDGTPFRLYTDASKLGIAYILAQLQQSEEKVIAYGARGLKACEKNYGITDLEALAVIQGVKHYQSYLQHATSFEIITDHQPLLSFVQSSQPTGRRARWILFLSQFKYEIKFKPGLKHSNVDAFSRVEDLPISEEFQTLIDDEYLDELLMCNLAKRNRRYNRRQQKWVKTDVGDALVPSWEELEMSVEVVRREQKKEKAITSLLEYLDNGQLPPNDKEARQILLNADNFVVRNDILYHIWSPKRNAGISDSILQLVIPVNLVNTVLASTHDSVLAAHLGYNKTLTKIRQRYYWANMNKDIDNWVRSCESCAQRKTSRHKELAPLVPLRVVDTPFARVSVDFLGPLPVTSDGNQHILCFTDHYSRWPIIVPAKDTSAATVAKAFFERVICDHGAPNFLLSDRGAAFMSELVKETCKLFGVTKLNSSSYRPQTDGCQERFNSVILATLSHYVNVFQNDWDSYLQPIAFAYRSSVCDNSVGYSPFFLLYGREPMLPLDVCILPERMKSVTAREQITQLIEKLELSRQLSREINEKNRIQMKLRYDEHAKAVNYDVGDCVYLFVPHLSKAGNNRKLARLWTGPFVIVKRRGPVNFQLRNLQNNKLLPVFVHADRLKWAYDRFVRPTNDVQPENVEARVPIPELSEIDVHSEDLAPIGISVTTEEETGLPLETVKASTTFFEVEKILKGRRKDGKLQYFVKWRGYGNKDNSWVDAGQLNDAALKYLEEFPVKIVKR